MPSVSKKQHAFMAMCSTPGGRAKAQGKCPPMKVAREFRHADKGASFKRSGAVKDGGKRYS